MVLIGKRAQGDIIERYQKLELRSHAERRGETKAETIKEQQLKLPILRRQFSSAAISLSIEGPGEIIGENPFALVGGAGAVWVRTKESTGTIRLLARHPYLPSKTVEIRVVAAVDEGV